MKRWERKKDSKVISGKIHGMMNKSSSLWEGAAQSS